MVVDEPKVIALPLSRARQQIVEEAQWVVRKLARGLARRTGHATDELVSAGNLGLVEMARRYDHTEETPFAIFAYHRVRGAMLDVVNKARKTQRRTGYLPEQILRDLSGDPDPEANEAEAREALDAAAGALAAAALLLEDASIDSASPEDQLQAHQASQQKTLGLQTAVASLEEPQRKLVELHYFEGVALKDVAEQLGMPYRTAKRRHVDALTALSKRMTRAD